MKILFSTAILPFACLPLTALLPLAVCASGTAAAATQAPVAEGFRNLVSAPDSVTVITEAGTVELRAEAGAYVGEGLRVGTVKQADGLHVSLSAPALAVKKLHLHWKGAPEGKDWEYLGDAWERSYGDLEWKAQDGKRFMPWYFLASNGRVTHGYGVMTLPSAVCMWKADEGGVTLIANVRSGGVGVKLGERTLDVCTVVSRQGKVGETPFAAARSFCRLLCPNPRMPKEPVYGFNDWYCAYGKTTADSVRGDAAYINSLSPVGGNRPYMVIDDGWQANAVPGTAKGAWHRGNTKFPDMKALAADIVKAGAKPGIWLRLLVAQPGQPATWKLARDRQYLDPSVPEVRAYVVETVKRLREWGFVLIKHDFSTADITGYYGLRVTTDDVNKDGWAFADRSRTTAEIITDFYRSIREGAGEEVAVMGCTTVGHLSAGIFEVSRTGDDTSGKDWARTRKMGVNTLAFRMPQHGAFFAIDADCMGLTGPETIPWEKNKQWLELLAGSGTPLFVSVRRGILTPDQEQVVKKALATASRPLPVGEPLDWFEGRLPSHWKLDGVRHDFSWGDASVPPKK